MTKITIERLEPVGQGDLVLVRAIVSPAHAQATAAVSAHGSGESQTLELTRRPGGLEGSFRPDKPGRWWISVSTADKVAEGCVWVRASHVPPVQT